MTLDDQLKRLKLNGMLETYQTRLQQGYDHSMSYPEVLGLLLQDEIGRRDAQSLAKRLIQAKFEQEQTIESYELSHYPVGSQQLIRELFTGNYMVNHHHAIIMGPTGTGKTHLAQALGHHACRLGFNVRFIRATVLFHDLYASRADHTWEKLFKKFLHYDLLIIDDFGLKQLTQSHAEDMYELIVQGSVI